MHSKHRKAFRGLAGVVGSLEGKREAEVLRDFLEAGYLAIRGQTLTGAAWQTNEAEYMKLVQRCREPKQTMKRYSEMLAIAGMALQQDCRDFLGPTFMEIGSSAQLGQFFTPDELSRMMARMSFTPDIEATIAERGYFTAQEPAAGMGGMVLATAHVMREAGYDPARHVHWQMIEIDFQAMAGCYIQVALADISGVVIHGDTLRLKQQAASLTPAAVLHPKVFESGAPTAEAQAAE